MSLSRAERGQLVGLMAKLGLANSAPPPPRTRPKRKKKKKKASGMQGIPAGVTRGTSASGAQPSNGEIVVTRCELLDAVVVSTAASVGSVALLPSSTALSWLHKLRSAFDRIEWLSAKLHWKPFVGTQTSGSVAFGVDWNSVAATVTRAKVQACTPVYESPVWQAGNLNLPARYLMSRKVYHFDATDEADRQPGKLIWAVAGASAATVGEIWCTYKVRLSGTTA